jgi:hypothetical protein
MSLFLGPNGADNFAIFENTWKYSLNKGWSNCRYEELVKTVESYYDGTKSCSGSVTGSGILESVPASMACFSSASVPGCASSSGSTSAPLGAFAAGHACLTNGV